MGEAFLASTPPRPNARGTPSIRTNKKLLQALPVVPSGAKPPLWFQSIVASYCKVTWDRFSIREGPEGDLLEKEIVNLLTCHPRGEGSRSCHRGPPGEGWRASQGSLSASAKPRSQMRNTEAAGMTALHQPRADAPSTVCKKLQKWPLRSEITNVLKTFV